jgi:hypothetical protein
MLQKRNHRNRFKPLPDKFNRESVLIQINLVKAMLRIALSGKL